MTVVSTGVEIETFVGKSLVDVLGEVGVAKGYLLPTLLVFNIHGGKGVDVLLLLI